MPKIKVIRPTEEIKKELAELEENIQTAAASIKEMKTTRRTLRKELELAQAKEAEEKQAEERANERKRRYSRISEEPYAIRAAALRAAALFFSFFLFS